MVRKTVLTLVMLVAGVVAALAANGFTLVIDAGHGGHDTGAKGAFSQEKDINLKVALAFGQYVEQNCKDVKVIYTRKTDVFIPLKTRANIANKNNADLFISVHTNALPNGRIARGFEVYTLGMHRAKDNLDVAMRENSVIEEEDNYQQTYQGFDPKSSESYIMFEFMQSANMKRSVELAKMIESRVCSTANRNNMGVHQAGFLVLRETSMPSCLIELGFITTSDEEEFLNTDNGVDLLAQGIYKAFTDYKSRYYDRTLNEVRSQPVTVPSSQPQPVSVQNVVPKAAPASSSRKKRSSSKKESRKQEARQETRQKTTKSGPVFKVQIFAVVKQLSPGDPLFKGHTDVTGRKDIATGLTKYTIGSSCDYEEISKLRNSLKADFPEAYIVAFKDGNPMALTDAIKEYKKTKANQVSTNK